MRKLCERLFMWAGRKLYGKENWPPMLVLVLVPKRERETEDGEPKPKVFH